MWSPTGRSHVEQETNQIPNHLPFSKTHLPSYVGLCPDTCPGITFSVFIRLDGFNGFGGCWRERRVVCYTWTSHATAVRHRQQLCTSSGGRRDTCTPTRLWTTDSDNPLNHSHFARDLSCFPRFLCSRHATGISETHSHPSLPLTGKLTH